MKYTLLLIMTFTLLFSCTENPASDSLAFENGYTEKSQFKNVNQAIDNDAINPKSLIPKYLIKNASLNIEVNKMDSSLVLVNRIIAKSGGYIGNLERINSDYEIRNMMDIRVPNAQLEITLQAIEAISSNILKKEIKTRDVGEEYIDAQNRLTTQEIVQARYLEVLRNKAKTVEDILATERQLGQIQEDIEAMKGKLNYLDNRIQMSTIKLSITQELQPQKEPTLTSLFFTRAGNGFTNGWNMILEITLGFINIWPLLILLTLFLFQRKRVLGLVRR